MVFEKIIWNKFYEFKYQEIKEDVKLIRLRNFILNTLLLKKDVSKRNPHSKKYSL